jgi:succinate-semialdehyde dehydrogenase/glutarate-semialdehyde dehydrogenase
MCWIDGRSITLPKSFSVFNPATGKEIGNVPLDEGELTTQAIESAWAAFSTWSKRSAGERATYLHSWADRLIEHKRELAELLSMEQGKPMLEAKEEIEGAVEFIRWYAEEGKRIQGEVLTPLRANQRISVIRQPVGVAALITPWNYPAAMVTRKVAPALAAGCTVILKPAKETPLIAIALFEQLMATGIPAGVANLVTGEAAKIAQVLLNDHRVRKISFTGSTEVGKRLMSQAAAQVKRISLELGGNAPCIVFSDADIDLAAERIVLNKFENCGQMCNGINVVYVHETIASKLEERIIQLVKRMKVGKGSDPDVKIGPLINQRERQKVHELVLNAKQQGATLLLGGDMLEKDEFHQGAFYAPTIMNQVHQNMRCVQEEIFGPVLPILTFQTEEEVIKQVNQTSYGLAAYFFTKDHNRVHRVSEALEFGMIGVNGTSLSVPQAPFGGIKESGQGREGGTYGLEEYLELKYISTILD